MKADKSPKYHIQLIWGGALILMGVAVFFKVTQVMPKLTEVGQSAFSITLFRIGMYLMGIILVGGGLKKVMAYFTLDKKETERNVTDKNF